MQGWLFHFTSFSFAPDNTLDGMLIITEWGENNRILFVQAQCIYFFQLFWKYFWRENFELQFIPQHI